MPWDGRPRLRRDVHVPQVPDLDVRRSPGGPHALLEVAVKLKPVFPATERDNVG